MWCKMGVPLIQGIPDPWKIGWLIISYNLAINSLFFHDSLQSQHQIFFLVQK